MISTANSVCGLKSKLLYSNQNLLPTLCLNNVNVKSTLYHFWLQKNLSFLPLQLSFVFVLLLVSVLAELATYASMTSPYSAYVLIVSHFCGVLQSARYLQPGTFQGALLFQKKRQISEVSRMPQGGPNLPL